MNFSGKGARKHQWKLQGLVYSRPTYYRWFQINKNGARNVLSCSGFTEKGVERIVSASNGLVARHLAIRLNSMLQAIQFPTSIANLHSGLSNVNWDALTLKKKTKMNWKIASKLRASEGIYLQYLERNSGVGELLEKNCLTAAVAIKSMKVKQRKKQNEMKKPTKTSRGEIWLLPLLTFSRGRSQIPVSFR